MWPGPSSTQRQARKLILGPRPSAKTRLLSFNRTQPKVVTSLHTGHNTLKRHLYLKVPINRPLCKEVWSRGRNLSPRFEWDWSSGFTQTCTGFLLLGPIGCQHIADGWRRFAFLTRWSSVHLQVLLSATPQGRMFPEVSHPQALLGCLVSISWKFQFPKVVSEFVINF